MPRLPDLQPNAAPAPTDRRLGVVDHDRQGPTLLVVGGIHGNEPSGILAFQRILDRLQRDDVPVRGRFVGLAGNLEALRTGSRFVEEDLNRIWSPERVARLDDPDSTPTSVDGAQQCELWHALRSELERATGPVYFLDLHTSSADGKPFVCIGDTLRNRGFALHMPVPVLLGLEEQVDGALLEHINNLGHVTVGVEAGRHDAPSSVDHHEAFIGVALAASGCVEASELPALEEFRRVLHEATRGLPRVLEVRHRHAIRPEHAFAMEPGFHNFDQVREGQRLGRDVQGAVVAPETGRVLLPLYQGQGSDGFFVVREFRPLWLRVSAWLRRFRVGDIVHWLPGVQRSQDDPDTVVANRRVARWFTVELFHLLGFRKERERGNLLQFSRRRESIPA